MSDEEAVDRTEWLLEPPGVGEVRLVVELGEGAELSPAAVASLERLMADIDSAEVEGFMLNTGLNVGLFGTILMEGQCNKLSCNRHTCSGTYTCDQYSSSSVYRR